ncbi:MAG: hypothetical protein WCO84_09690, partial [bacterium]
LKRALLMTKLYKQVDNTFPAINKIICHDKYGIGTIINKSYIRIFWLVWFNTCPVMGKNPMLIPEWDMKQND